MLLKKNQDLALKDQDIKKHSSPSIQHSPTAYNTTRMI